MKSGQISSQCIKYLVRISGEDAGSLFSVDPRDLYLNVSLSWARITIYFMYIPLSPHSKTHGGIN